MVAFYNEIDPFAAEWLRRLIDAGLIAPGVVDERDIRDIKPEELRNYEQCHFFAGIGGWSRALRLAGVADNEPLWTGSCPCQPFSAAGKGGGFDDERHLWPDWFWLIEQCRPPVVFGEQVASKDGLAWLDLVQADMEGSGYAVAANDLCAAGVGAPHIRQRLYFVAESDEGQRGPRGLGAGAARRAQPQPSGSGAPGLVVDADHEGPQGRRERGSGADQLAAGAAGVAVGLADVDGGDASAEGLQRGRQHGQQPEDGGAGVVADREGNGRQTRLADDGGGASATGCGRIVGVAGLAGSGEASGRPGPTNGVWRDADWLCCRDGKWRPVEPGTFPLAHGVPGRVGRLRAYGNAIVPQVAEAFIRAYFDARRDADPR